MSQAAPRPKPLPITGIGLATSLGTTVDENWQALLRGEDGFAPIEDFDTSKVEVKDGGHAPLPRFALSPNHADGRERALDYYRATIREALTEAGGAVHPERTALVLGSSLASSASSTAFWQAFIEHEPEGADFRDLRSYDVEPMLDALCESFGIRGPAMLVSNACAAGASAIAIGREMILGDEADRVIAVGGDTLEMHTFAGFNALGLLTPEPLHPFCKSRRGMKLGDGFGAVVLDREAERPLAYLLGAGESADAHSLTQPHPEGAGAAFAMRRALRSAGLTTDAIDYINLHATATASNDSSEHAALVNVFGDRLADIVLHACKPSVGHTLGAAGAVEAVVCVKVLLEQLAPRTLGVEDDIELTPARFSDGEPLAVRHAMSNSFGFGGSNASLVFGRADEDGGS